MRSIKNVRLPDSSTISTDEALWEVLLDEKDFVTSIKNMLESSDCNGENWDGDFLSPMGVDLQINGGLGLDFSNLNFDQLHKLDQFRDLLWHDGVEAICPTFVSCSRNDLRIGLEVLRASRKRSKKNRCELLGAHLEGPFICPNRIGAHNSFALRKPNLFTLTEMINSFEDEIALVTLAPEITGSSEVIFRLKELGVTISLGHSSCDAASARSAFSKGVGMLTHTFNAMPQLVHRAPGPIAEAIVNGKIFMGLIADGIHVHSTMAVLLQRLSPGKLFLVSDAISPYGMNDGRFAWDKRSVHVENGTCRLDDGTLAGTTLPLLSGVQNLANWGINPAASIWSGTIAPREALGKKGHIVDYLIGKPLAHLLRWHFDSFSKNLSWQKAM